MEQFTCRHKSGGLAENCGLGCAPSPAKKQPLLQPEEAAHILVLKTALRARVISLASISFDPFENLSKIFVKLSPTLGVYSAYDKTPDSLPAAKFLCCKPSKPN